IDNSHGSPGLTDTKGRGLRQRGKEKGQCCNGCNGATYSTVAPSTHTASRVWFIGPSPG
ncbi:hypothetical protein O988_09440, partial [Pseudogymnoascus sp. VKM F-3808]